MFHNHNVETDTKLFQIRMQGVYWGDVWAASSGAALEKALDMYPDYPQGAFKMEFSGNLYPVKILSISDVCTILDEHQIPYHNPGNDEHQLILQGTNDILEGGYSLEDESWDFFIRSTATKSAMTLTFKTSEQLVSILRTYYSH